MIKFYPTVKALFVVSFLLVVASAAQAQATRTWVSGVGDDVNPCSRTAPCKTFAGAISKTAKDGEISVLDPGGFVHTMSSTTLSVYPLERMRSRFHDQRAASRSKVSIPSSASEERN